MKFPVTRMKCANISEWCMQLSLLKHEKICNDKKMSNICIGRGYAILATMHDQYNHGDSDDLSEFVRS